jgi:hypothetical protein
MENVSFAINLTVFHRIFLKLGGKTSCDKRYTRRQQLGLHWAKTWEDTNFAAKLWVT